MAVNKPIARKPNNPRPKRLGPFRGPTPEGVIQTLDVGVGIRDEDGGPKRFKTNVEKHREREYLGIDEYLRFPEVGQNFKLERIRFLEKILELIKEGKKVRSINFTYPMRFISSYELNKIFPLLSEVLLPNGKVFVTSEDLDFVRHFIGLARNAGYAIRLKRRYTNEDIDKLVLYELKPEEIEDLLKRRYSSEDFEKIKEQVRKAKEAGKRGTISNLPLTFYQNQFLDRNPYFLELTYSLKTAIPDKEQRRNWPRE